MIQRIQSVYLAIVILLSLLFIKGSVFNFADASGSTFSLTITGNMIDQAGKAVTQVENFWPLIILSILIPSVSLITIFLYKKRKIQLILAVSVIVMASFLAVAVTWYAFSATKTFSYTIIPGLKMAIPLFILLFSILACRGILKDDRLVRSYERLR
jgi:hypothetical protein